MAASAGWLHLVFHGCSRLSPSLFVSLFAVSATFYQTDYIGTDLSLLEHTLPGEYITYLSVLKN